jgi:5-methyltetrahydrofolate--homocysteine methyltransferase
LNEQLESIKQAVVNGRHNEIESMVQAAADRGEILEQIIDECLIGAMDIVGRSFADGLIFVPEMLIAAVTMKKGLAILQPLLMGKGAASKGTILMCTVKGDLHDIGKNLVIMMLEGAGFSVVDGGVDLSVEKLVEKVAAVKPQVLGLSALLTTTMPEMEKVIRMLEEKGLRDNVKVMVGGAPVDAAFAEKIGADGYGKDAAEAVQIVKGFLSQN